MFYNKISKINTLNRFKYYEWLFEINEVGKSHQKIIYKNFLMNNSDKSFIYKNGKLYKVIL